MYKLIIKDKEYLKQQPTMEKPKRDDFYRSVAGPFHTVDTFFDYHKYRAALKEYEQHLASLKEYPVHPDHYGHWKEGQEVREGDFEISEIEEHYDSALGVVSIRVAIPKQEDLWDELRELFRLLEGSDNEDWEHNKTELKQRFTLTRKI